MKVYYDESMAPLQKKLSDCEEMKKPTSAQLQSEISRKIQSVVRCDVLSEPFYKAMLQTMVVHKDGTLDIKICHLPQTWVYRLVYHKAPQE